MILPIFEAPYSVNQRLPSGPTAMPLGSLAVFESGNSVSTPAVVIRPIFPAPYSVNQRLPSGPVTMLSGSAVADGNGYSIVSVPAVGENFAIPPLA